MKEEISDKIKENLMEQTKLEIEFLTAQIAKYEALLLLEEEKEPSAFLKKAHVEWERNQSTLKFELEKNREQLASTLEDFQKYENML